MSRLGWLGGILLALAVRSATFPQVFSTPFPSLVGTDSFYHLRRIHHIVLNYPSIPTRDPLLNFPDPAGAEIPYEPGFDFLLATLVKLLQPFTATSIETTARISAWTLPLLGLLLFPLVISISRRVQSGRTRAIVLLLLAILPCVTFPAFVGQVDHHVFEPVIICLCLWLLLWTLEHPDNRRRPLVGGVLLGLSLLFWRGMVLPTTLMALIYGVRSAWQASSGPADYLTRAGIPQLFGAAAVVMVPIAIVSAAPDPWTYFMISRLQPTFVLVLALAFWLVGRTAALIGPRYGLSGLPPERILPLNLALFLAIGIVPLMLVGAIFPSFLLNLARGFGFLVRADVFVQAVTEQRPLFQDDDGHFSMAYAVYLYGAFFPIWPLLVVLGRRSWFKPGARLESLYPAPLPAPTRVVPFARLAIGLFTATSLVLALYQRRYAAHFAPFYVLTLAPALLAGFDSVRARPTLWKYVLSIGFVALLLPTFAFTLLLAQVPTQPAALLQASQWIAANTEWPHGTDDSASSSKRVALVETSARAIDPAAASLSPPANADRFPYGVLAAWDEGHHIVTLGQRPSYGNPFGIEWFREGLVHSARFWLAPAAQIEATMDACRARYALVSFRLGLLRDEARFLGLRPDDFAQFRSGQYFPGPEFAKLASSQLYLHDGSATDQHPAITGLRLVWEGGSLSPGSPALAWVKPDAPVYKLYERVVGSILRGATTPDAHVVVTARVKTPAGRLFTWSHDTLAQDDGSFELRVPYASQGMAPGAARVVGGIRVTLPEGSRVLEITDFQVRSGAVIGAGMEP